MWYMPQLSFFPVYLQELGLPPAAIGGVVAGAQLAGMAVALLGGWVAGLLGSKWVLVCGLALSGVASLAFQVHTPWLVAALWFIGGAGLALITVGGASYLTRLSLRGTLGMLAAIYALSMTVGGAIGTPIAGVIIERRGFSAFGWASTALIATSALLATLFMIYLRDRTAERASLRVFWSGALAMIRRAKVRQLLGLRSLPTIFYGMLTVLIPVLLNGLSGNKLVVAAYATTNLIVASAAQLLAGRAGRSLGCARSDAGRLHRHHPGWPGPGGHREHGLGAVYLRCVGGRGSLVPVHADVRLGRRRRPEGRARLVLWPAARRLEPQHDHRLPARRLARPHIPRAAVSDRRPAQRRLALPGAGILRSTSRTERNLRAPPDRFIGHPQVHAPRSAVHRLAISLRGQASRRLQRFQPPETDTETALAAHNSTASAKCSGVTPGDRIVCAA